MIIFSVHIYKSEMVFDFDRTVAKYEGSKLGRKYLVTVILTTPFVLE